MSGYIQKEKKAFEVANYCLDVVNAYKGAVGLPQTPRNDERMAGIVAGVIRAWENPNQTPEENHNGWVERMQANGWVYGEQVSEEDKTHPALVAYSEVPPMYMVNDLIFMAICKANTPAEYLTA